MVQFTRLRTKNGKYKVLKAYKKFSPFREDIDFIEIDISIRLHHPYVIPLLDFAFEYETSSQNSVLTVVYPLGDANFMKFGKSLSEEQLIKYFLQLLLGLKYVHDRNIILSDIKPENVVYFKDEDAVKFIDFGLSIYDDALFFTYEVGTPTYLAPEVYLRESYMSKSADIWSLGMTFLSVLNKRDVGLKAIKYNEKKYYMEVLEKEIREALDKVKNKDIVDLIDKMLVVDENKRASLKQLLKLPIFSKYKGNERIIQKIYPGSPIRFNYLYTYNLTKIKAINDVMQHFNRNIILGKAHGKWSIINGIDIIKYLLQLNFIDDTNAQYVASAAVTLSFRLFPEAVLIDFRDIVPEYIDVYKAGHVETEVFKKIGGKIFRENIFGLLYNNGIDFYFTKLFDYVMTTEFEGELPTYTHNFLYKMGKVTNNPLIDVFVFKED